MFNVFLFIPFYWQWDELESTISASTSKVLKAAYFLMYPGILSTLRWDHIFFLLFCSHFVSNFSPFQTLTVEITSRNDEIVNQVTNHMRDNGFDSAGLIKGQGFYDLVFVKKRSWQTWIYCFKKSYIYIDKLMLWIRSFLLYYTNTYSCFM